MVEDTLLQLSRRGSVFNGCFILLLPDVGLLLLLLARLLPLLELEEGLRRPPDNDEEERVSRRLSRPMLSMLLRGEPGGV